MVKVLVLASIVWPLMLAAAVWDQAARGGSVWTAVFYAATSRICHQRPERSFHTAGVKWPVCGRCSGLYLGAPAGALAAIVMARRRRNDSGRMATGSGLVLHHSASRPSNVAIQDLTPWQSLPESFLVLAVASVPTIVTLVLEWAGLAAISTLARFVAAVPVGAVIAHTLVSVVSGRPRPIEYTGAE